MTDNAFQLTPRDIRTQEFSREVRGYGRAQVEEFKQRVADEVERLVRERAQLEERLRNFQEQLRAFRDRERAMNEALVAAQQLRADSREQADREADSITGQAKVEASRILADAVQEERSIRERSEMAARQFAAYIASFRALLERELAEVDALQAHARASIHQQAEQMASQHS